MWWGWRKIKLAQSNIWEPCGWPRPSGCAFKPWAQRLPWLFGQNRLKEASKHNGIRSKVLAWKFRNSKEAIEKYKSADWDILAGNSRKNVIYHIVHAGCR